MQTSTHTLPGRIPTAGSAGAGGNRLTNAPKSYPPEWYNGRGPAAQRPSGPAAQRPSGPAAQRPSGPAAQRPSGPAAQRPDVRPAPHRPPSRPGAAGRGILAVRAGARRGADPHRLVGHAGDGYIYPNRCHFEQRRSILWLCQRNPKHSGLLDRDQAHRGRVHPRDPKCHLYGYCARAECRCGGDLVRRLQYRRQTRSQPVHTGFRHREVEFLPGLRQ